MGISRFAFGGRGVFGVKVQFRCSDWALKFQVLNFGFRGLTCDFDRGQGCLAQVGRDEKLFRVCGLGCVSLQSKFTVIDFGQYTKALETEASQQWKDLEKIYRGLPPQF